MAEIRLGIVEDDTIVRDSLNTYFSQMEDIRITISGSSFEDFVEALQKRETVPPTVMLLDIQLPGLSGIEGIPILKKYLPNVNIIMLTTFEDNEKIFSALCAGAVSYLSKQSTLASIYECIRTVSGGGSYMSPGIARKVVQHFVQATRQNSHALSARQREIVDAIVDGLSYKMIAGRLGISLDTVRTHIMQIYRELNIHSKGELIKWALER
ncbi:MAG: response regulator transcription factor [Saprospiraceae bacterium]|nr:response regulator transcription factor [Saprospiraceae bacterium]